MWGNRSSTTSQFFVLHLSPFFRNPEFARVVSPLEIAENLVSSWSGGAWSASV
jgi:hypothetical protein